MTTATVTRDFPFLEARACCLRSGQLLNDTGRFTAAAVIRSIKDVDAAARFFDRGGRGREVIAFATLSSALVKMSTDRAETIFDNLVSERWPTLPSSLRTPCVAAIQRGVHWESTRRSCLSLDLSDMPSVDMYVPMFVVSGRGSRIVYVLRLSNSI